MGCHEWASVPGLRIANTDALQARLGEEGYADLAPVLRVFVPGDEETMAEISVTSDDGTAAGSSFSVDLEPGVVEDLALDGLVDGSYTVQVTASHPLVAGVRVSTVAPSAPEGESPGSDFAWLASADPVSDRAIATIAPGPSARVHLVNPTDAEAEVTLAASDGDDVTVTVPAGGSAYTDVVENETYQIEGFDSLYAAVSYSGDALIAGYAVQPPAASAGAITIIP